MASWRDTLTRPPGDRNDKQDPRFLKKYVNAPTLTRGQMMTIRQSRTTTGYIEDTHRFHFLTNPWEISTSYNVDNALDFTDPANYGAMMDTPPLQEGLITTSFSMLLDRTYEVWSGTIPEGVLHDIAQFERVLGMPDILGGSVLNRGLTADAARAARGQAASGEWREDVSPARNQFPGVIVKRPVRFIFGGRHSYTFDGIVTSLSITMMKFNAQMVPTRAGINISAHTWGDAETASISAQSLGGPMSGDQGTVFVPSSDTPSPSSSASGGGGGTFVTA